MFFRIVVLFFTIASIVLTAWSLVGSFKNQSHLTSNYLIDFSFRDLNVSSLIIDAAKNKREELAPSPTTQDPLITGPAKRFDLDLLTSNFGGDIGSALSGAGIDVGGVTSLAAQQTSGAEGNVLSKIGQIASTASIPSSVASLASQLAGNFDDVLENVVKNVNYTDLGLADYYSISYWGYCRGFKGGNHSENIVHKLGNFGKNFNSESINWVYCSPPKVGYKLDPLALIKHEITNNIEKQSDGLGQIAPQISEMIQAQLVTLVSGLTYENIGLPGSLKKDLNLLHDLTVAAFALLLAGACLAFISLIFQLTGLCVSPHNACLSCLNYLFMFFVFLVIVIGAGLSTGGYVFARKQINDNTTEFGIKSALSVQYYAFAWSAMVAAFLMLVISGIGYCCGCFGGTGGRYRRVQEPPMAYDHKM